MDGAKLMQLMIDAGFIDVRARKIKLEVGTWGISSLYANNFVLITDPELGRKIFDVRAGAFQGLADTLIEQFPEEEERQKFNDAMAADLSNPVFRLFIWV